jgi:hypothetical protein
MKVIRIPDFHAVVPVPKNLVGSLGGKPFLGGGEQFREIALEPHHGVESPLARLMQKGSAGEFSIRHHIITKAATEMADGAAQESAGGVVLAVLGAVRLDIQGKTKPVPTMLIITTWWW